MPQLQSNSYGTNQANADLFDSQTPNLLMSKTCESDEENNGCVEWTCKNTFNDAHCNEMVKKDIRRCNIARDFARFGCCRSCAIALGAESLDQGMCYISLHNRIRNKLNNIKKLIYIKVNWVSFFTFTKYFRWSYYSAVSLCREFWVWKAHIRKLVGLRYWLRATKLHEILRYMQLITRFDVEVMSYAVCLKLSL